MMLRHDEFVLKIDPKDEAKYEKILEEIAAWYGATVEEYLRSL